MICDSSGPISLSFMEQAQFGCSEAVKVVENLIVLQLEDYFYYDIAHLNSRYADFENKVEIFPTCF